MTERGSHAKLKKKRVEKLEFGRPAKRSNEQTYEKRKWLFLKPEQIQIPAPPFLPF
jgi:hypothetical protein